MAETTLPSEEAVLRIKEFRKEIDVLIQKSEYFLGLGSSGDSTAFEIRQSSKRELELIRMHLQEAKMWGGKVLETLGNPFPTELADRSQERGVSGSTN